MFYHLIDISNPDCTLPTENRSVVPKTSDVLISQRQSSPFARSD